MWSELIIFHCLLTIQPLLLFPRWLEIDQLIYQGYKSKRWLWGAPMPVAQCWNEQTRDETHKRLPSCKNRPRSPTRPVQQNCCLLPWPTAWIQSLGYEQPYATRCKWCKSITMKAYTCGRETCIKEMEKPLHLLRMKLWLQILSESKQPLTICWTNWRKLSKAISFLPSSFWVELQWYHTLKQSSRHKWCAQPVAIGPKTTGKMTSASTALGMLGMPSHFHIRDMTDVEASQQMERKTFPSILDYLDDIKMVKKIVNNSFNCTTRSTTRGSSVPKTGNLVAINTEKLNSLSSNFRWVQQSYFLLPMHVQYDGNRYSLTFPSAR